MKSYNIYIYIYIYILINIYLIYKIIIIIYIYYLLTLIIGASNQEEFIECSDNQIIHIKKEENEQDNTDKSKREIKSMHEENLEKEISCKKEVNGAYALHNIHIEYI